MEVDYINAVCCDHVVLVRILHVSQMNCLRSIHNCLNAVVLVCFTHYA